MDDYWLAVIWAILPTLVVLGTFVFILRGIIRFDRTERRVYARIEAAERRRRGLPPASAVDAGSAAASVDGAASGSSTV